MTRLYLNESLQAKETVTLNADQSHYLARVLRYQVGDLINIFNERDGEWRSKVIEIAKKSIIVQLEEQVRSATPTQPLWLAFSPLKNDAMGFLIEKATELGVTHLQPIITERCNTQRLNLERLKKNAIEASQQCERLDVPQVLEAIELVKFLEIRITSSSDLIRGSIDSRVKHENDNLKMIKWFVALERAEALPIKTALEQSNTKQWGFIIGPEGGFTSNEVSLFNKYNITPVSLGPRILRAETAALNVLAIASSM